MCSAICKSYQSLFVPCLQLLYLESRHSEFLYMVKYKHGTNKDFSERDTLYNVLPLTYEIYFRPSGLKQCGRLRTGQAAKEPLTTVQSADKCNYITIVLACNQTAHSSGTMSGFMVTRPRRTRSGLTAQNLDLFTPQTYQDITQPLATRNCLVCSVKVRNFHWASFHRKVVKVNQ